MSSPLENAGRVRTWLLGAMVAYLLLLGYSVLTGDALAQLLTYVLFGFIALGIGAVLIDQGGRSPVGAAGGCFVAGGIARFAWLATGVGAFEAVSALGIVAGIVLYVVGGRYSRQR